MRNLRFVQLGILSAKRAGRVTKGALSRVSSLWGIPHFRAQSSTGSGTARNAASAIPQSENSPRGASRHPVIDEYSRFWTVIED